jgi:mono/diheme cytochrome c family protein
MGLAQGPDGSLYVAETEKGKVWRIMYKGKKSSFGSHQLKTMENRKGLSHIRNPDIVNDNLDKDEGIVGAKVYNVYCAACHQQDGKGASGRFPPLAGTDWVTGDKQRLISLVLNGLQGSITVNGEDYINAMPQHSFLSDEEVANALTYIRQSFGNNASPITVDEVVAVRRKANTTQ